MANITMADYVGFIFSEITRARDMADRESIRIAQIYAQNEILKNFSVPRFKIPEMNLTIPVIISGARFSTTQVFNMSQPNFKNFIVSRLNNVVKTIIIKKSNVNNDFTVVTDKDIFINPIFRRDVFVKTQKTTGKKQAAKAAAPLKADADETAIDEFYQQLINNTDPGHPENIIQVKWASLFNKRIADNNLMEDYTKQNPEGELYKQSIKEVTDTVKANTVVSSTKIDNLLVDPETNVVKNMSSDATVFVINAKITEEGIFVKSVKGTNGEPDQQIVEFE